MSRVLLPPGIEEITTTDSHTTQFTFTLKIGGSFLGLLSRDPKRRTCCSVMVGALTHGAKQVLFSTLACDFCTVYLLQGGSKSDLEIFKVTLHCGFPVEFFANSFFVGLFLKLEVRRRVNQPQPSSDALRVALTLRAVDPLLAPRSTKNRGPHGFFEPRPLRDVVHVVADRTHASSQHILAIGLLLCRGSQDYFSPSLPGTQAGPAMPKGRALGLK